MAKKITVLLKKKRIYTAKVYSSPLMLAKGLRFSKPLQKNQAILLASSKENLQAIDMLFVFFPIDALWLNKRKQVIHIVRDIKPFTVAVSSPTKAQFILECPANTTQKIKLHDAFSFNLHQ